MVHEGQRLTFSLEPGDDTPGVHPQLDDLESHAATESFLLFSHVDHAAAAFANLLQQFVAANPVAGFISQWTLGTGGSRFRMRVTSLMSAG